MTNKPKYNFFKNSKYALNGLIEIFKNESSFKIEVALAIPFLILSFILNISVIEHILLIFVTLFVLFAEIVNSAIERVVDLVTKEHHELAKNAKDAGSAAVCISIVIASLTWSIILFNIIF